MAVGVKTKKYICDEINRLSGGQLDKPVDIRGNIYDRKILQELENLRVNMLESRCKVMRQLEHNSVSMAGILHDIKTPMALIAGYAECMQDGIGDKDYPALIRSTVDKLQDIVSSVNVSASLSMEMRDDIDVRDFVSAHPFFHALFSRYAENIESRQIRCIIGLCPALSGFYARNSKTVGLYVNKKLIDRVVQNLINNALRHTPKGGKIRITFHAGKQYFSVKVKDSGNGIRKADLPFIFERGFSTGTSENKGLGLSICKEIVERHGGSIKVKSKEGKGAAFIFRLPIVPVNK